MTNQMKKEAFCLSAKDFYFVWKTSSISCRQLC